MNLSGIPAKFTIPWGNSAGASYINTVPTASQIGINAGYASLTDGFVPLNDTPIAAGGVPPRIQDVNGALNVVTAWNRWQAAGGAIPYDSTFQSAVGGYPKECIIQSAVTPGLLWTSTVNSNMTNPDAGGAGWINLLALNSPSSLAINGYKEYPDSNSPSGYFLEQWAQVTTSATGSVNWTFPTPFPTALLNLQATFSYPGTGPGTIIAQVCGQLATLTYAPVTAFTTAGAYAAVSVFVSARGY